MTTQTTTDKIIAAKAAAGPEAYLWLHDSGDCILWPSEGASQDDDGQHAIARWTLSAAEAAALRATGEAESA